jgi:hypothetical protein
MPYSAGAQSRRFNKGKFHPASGDPRYVVNLQLSWPVCKVARGDDSSYQGEALADSGHRNRQLGNPLDRIHEFNLCLVHSEGPSSGNLGYTQ